MTCSSVEELKYLKRRVFMLENQVENISRLFEAQAQEMIAQNNAPNVFCKQCGMDVSILDQGSCSVESCPCGIN